jgi:hypothetical protein
MLISEVFHSLVPTFRVAEVDQLASNYSNMLRGDRRHCAVALTGAVTTVARGASLKNLLSVSQVSCALEHRG